MQTIKAAVCHSFGSALRIEEITIAPPAPETSKSPLTRSRSATAIFHLQMAHGAGHCPPSTDMRPQAASAHWGRASKVSLSGMM